MKTKILLLVCMAVFSFTACKKDNSVKKEEETKTEETKNDDDSEPTEGNIVITGNTDGKVKYDDKNITVKSFNVSKVLVYFYPASKQITIQSTEMDGIFQKYQIGMTFPAELPAVGKKTSAIGGTTPLAGLNVYEGGDLYPYSCINGSYTIEKLDDHNVTVLFTDIDMKQSFTPGFDKSTKRFTVKAFRVSGKY